MIIYSLYTSSSYKCLVYVSNVSLQDLFFNYHLIKEITWMNKLNFSLLNLSHGKNIEKKSRKDALTGATLSLINLSNQDLGVL